MNRDDHTKNFSFLRDQNGPWKLSPAFDITHAYGPSSQWNARHLMSVNGSFDDIGLADLRSVGDRHDVPGYREITREVLAAVDEWPDFATRAEVPDEVMTSINDTIARFRPR